VKIEATGKMGTVTVQCFANRSFVHSTQRAKHHPMVFSAGWYSGATRLIHCTLRDEEAAREIEIRINPWRLALAALSTLPHSLFNEPDYEFLRWLLAKVDSLKGSILK